VVSSTPVAVEYSITPLGQTLQTPYAALYAWAAAHEAEVQAAQQRYDRDASASPCGAQPPRNASSCTLGSDL
jgi:DNA-binding HxlR family transcriptional regulator